MARGKVECEAVAVDVNNINAVASLRPEASLMIDDRGKDLQIERSRAAGSLRLGVVTATSN